MAQSPLTASPKSAEGIVGPAQAKLVRHPKADRRGNGEAKPPRGWAEGPNGGQESWSGMERRDGLRRGVGPGSASGMHWPLAPWKLMLRLG